MKVIKYLIEGAAVAMAAHFIPKKGALKMREIFMLAVTAATVFLVLDMFAPAVGSAARSGAGIGIGLEQVGSKAAAAAAAAVEGFKGDDKRKADNVVGAEGDSSSASY